ncbi:hypothetical protein FHS20_003723 [Phyllobacterium endophyticum]|nr:hypothetical protein [Phyllobacterium endophyticum]
MRKFLGLLKLAHLFKSISTDNPSFENADSNGFSAESDWFLEFYNHASEHCPGVRFPMSALNGNEPNPHLFRCSPVTTKRPIRRTFLHNQL